MKDVPGEQRTARFRCCIVYMRHAQDPSPLIADASWEGFIMHELSGANGFGYDPLFLCRRMERARQNSQRMRKTALVIVAKLYNKF